MPLRFEQRPEPGETPSASKSAVDQDERIHGESSHFLALLCQILAARSIIGAAIRPLNLTGQAPFLAAAERGWRGRGGSFCVDRVIPTASP